MNFHRNEAVLKENTDHYGRGGWMMLEDDDGGLT